MIFKTKYYLTSDWVVYVIVSATIIGVSYETGMMSVSGFSGKYISAYVAFYISLSIFCAISQLIILNFVSNKIEKSIISRKRARMKVIKYGVTIVQFGIIALVIIISFEITTAFVYHKTFLMGILISSFVSAAVITSLLAWRFIIWLKSHRNRHVAIYLVATLFISGSAISGVLYLMDQLRYQPAIVHPKQYGDFVEHVARGNSSLVYIYVTTSAFAFVFLWLGTVFLLQSYQRKLGSTKYWVVMFAPLLYFLSQFQPVILNFLLSYASDNSVLFNVLYIMLVDASRPIGGVLFGFAFIHVARKLENKTVSGYLVVSGIGFLMLFVSYHAQALITTPFPPLGLLSASFFGLSSYLIFVGIYSSALSISQDSLLRSKIRRSVEIEVSFLKSIGTGEMNHNILDKVLSTSRNISESMPEETGISSSLTDLEIKDYVKLVLAETINKKNPKSKE